MHVSRECACTGGQRIAVTQTYTDANGVLDFSQISRVLLLSLVSPFFPLSSPDPSDLLG